MVATKVGLTVDDYMALPDDGKRYELINGELILAAAPLAPHQFVIAALIEFLRSFARRQGLGKVAGAPFDVFLARDIVLQPDVLFISNARMHILREGRIHGAPDLVVEVLSPSTESRDRNDKARLYWRHGVLEYWLVDTSRRTIEVFGAGRTGFELLAVYDEGDSLESPTLSGLSLDTGRVFADLGMLP